MLKAVFFAIFLGSVAMASGESCRQSASEFRCGERSIVMISDRESTHYQVNLNSELRFRLSYSLVGLENFRLEDSVRTVLKKADQQFFERAKAFLPQPVALNLLMLPTGENLQELHEASANHRVLEGPTAKGRICHLRTKKGVGHWDDDSGKEFSRTVTVGVKPKCHGRCGKFCNEGWFDMRFGQTYTQGCLNHDVCVDRYRNGNFGHCSNEFYAAMAGATFYPRCIFSP